MESAFRHPTFVSRFAASFEKPAKTPRPTAPADALWQPNRLFKPELVAEWRGWIEDLVREFAPVEHCPQLPCYMALLMTPPSIAAMHWVARSLLLRRGLKTRNSLLCGGRCCNYRATLGPVCALSLGDDNGIFLKCENAFASYASTVIVCVVAAFVNGVTLNLCGLWCSFMIALFYG